MTISHNPYQAFILLNLLSMANIDGARITPMGCENMLISNCNVCLQAFCDTCRSHSVQSLQNCGVWTDKRRVLLIPYTYQPSFQLYSDWMLFYLLYHFDDKLVLDNWRISHRMENCMYKNVSWRSCTSVCGFS